MNKETFYTIIKQIRNENQIYKLIFGKDICFKEIKEKCSSLIQEEGCRNKGNSDSRHLLYRCKTCEKTPSSCICCQCFDETKHQGHIYYSYLSMSQYTCDCGNEQYWKKEGFCNKHQHKFNGNIKEIIPKEINYCLKSLAILFQYSISFLMEKDNNGELNMIFKVLCQIDNIPYFHKLFISLLNEKYLFPSDSLLYNKYNYHSLTLFQRYFELSFVHQHLPDSVLTFLISFLTNISEMKFDYTSIYDLALASVYFDYSPNNGLESIFSGFIYDKSIAEYSLFKSGRFIQMIDIFINTIKIYSSGIIHDNVLKNVESLLDYINGLINNGIKYQCSLEEFSKVLELICCCSHLFPFYIKTGEHDETDPDHFEYAFLLLYSTLLCFSLIDVFDVDDFYNNHFNFIHQTLMNHVKTYLNNVPLININGIKIHLRKVGINQQVSPLSGINYFYLLILQKLINKNQLDKISISNEDAILLCETSFISLQFIHQFSSNVYVRNNIDVEYHYTFYINLFLPHMLNGDLNISKLMLKYITIDQFIYTLLVIFNVIELEPTNEIIDLNNSHFNTNNFGILLSVLIQMNRTPLIKKVFNDESFIKNIIAHIIMTGESHPTNISELIPFCELNINQLCDELMIKKGVLKEEWLNRINPLYPFLQPELQEQLKINTLFGDKSLKNNRYYFEGLNWNKDLFNCITSSLFWNIIKKGLSNENMIFILMLITDINSEIQNNICSTEDIKSLGIFNEENVTSITEILKNNYTQIKDFEIFIKGINNINVRKLLKFESCTVIPSPVKTTKLTKADLLKKKVLKKMNEKQTTFTLNEHIIEESSLEDQNEDFCVVCQSIKQSPLGRFIYYDPGFAVLIQRKKEGGKSDSETVFTTCKHHIHEECFMELINQYTQCPICKSKFELFLPLSNQISIINENTFNEKYSLIKIAFNNNKNKIFNVLMSCLISTLESLELAQFEKVDIHEDDFDILKSLFIALKSLTINLKSYLDDFIKYSNINSPLYLYIILRLYNQDIQPAYIQQVNNVMSIIAKIKPSLLSHKQINFIKPRLNNMNINGLSDCLSCEDAVNKLSISFEYCIHLIEPIIKNIPMTDEVPFLKTINYIDHATGNDQYTFIPTIPRHIPFIELPKTFEGVLKKYCYSKCDSCDSFISDVLLSRVCLYCGKVICTKRKCLEYHSHQCSCGFNVMLDLYSGAFCLNYRGKTNGIIVYEDEYGDCFDPKKLLIPNLLLNPLKVKLFVLFYFYSSPTDYSCL
ncbi:RING finger domain containing protein [Entamoeba histolytica HM-1:IMSS-B]|uniref:E3 ubiquitin-protein ligase n=1 Tax=Entamoeba histolytica HM-1:IMSS-B TaxID=885319 RepID=M3SDQ9_ENTH1|nr:RING finger domain containing protein [Entamoeba histolytica HM-1:IMSS-B]